MNTNRHEENDEIQMTNDELMTKPERENAGTPSFVTAADSLPVVTAFDICHFVIPSAFDIGASSLSHTSSANKSKSGSKRDTPLKVKP